MRGKQRVELVQGFVLYVQTKEVRASVTNLISTEKKKAAAELRLHANAVKQLKIRV